MNRFAGASGTPSRAPAYPMSSFSTRSVGTGITGRTLAQIPSSSRRLPRPQTRVGRPVGGKTLSSSERNVYFLGGTDSRVPTKKDQASCPRSERIPGRLRREFQIANIGAQPQSNTRSDRDQDNIICGQDRKTGEPWFPELRCAFDRTTEEIKVIIDERPVSPRSDFISYHDQLITIPQTPILRREVV
jgi:hypothetical protein